MRFPGLELSNICGYVDSLGNEYALVGTSIGMSIVDVSNPDSVFLVASIPGPTSIWREIKTWQHYAYVATEGGGGLQIVDLRSLPLNNLPFHTWKPLVNSKTLSSIHALHIDNGFVYLYGSNIGSKGIVIGDLADPYNPVFAGLFDGSYVHDGYVRNDTVWACQIYLGKVSAINVSNKANPVIVGSQQTPSAFPHNTWLSDNSKYLFTTDEVDNSYLAAYDVSNSTSIIFMDKIQSQNPGGQAIVHNTHILNDFAITSWYKDGVVITDCHRPQNLVNVGYVDDCPQSGGNYAGVWGVYPFLPSGTMVTSDIDSGLYVYTPTYVRACYFEGIVRDSACNNLLNNVHVELLGTNVLDSTDFTGNFKTGSADSGNYVAVFSKTGYISKSIPVTLNHGSLTTLNLKLIQDSSTSFYCNVKNLNGQNVLNVALQLNGPNSYNLVSDSNGEFYNCSTKTGRYNFAFGKWGYQTSCFDTLITSVNNIFSASIANGYYDDFSFNVGWTVNSSANAGIWTRAIPSGTISDSSQANPGSDIFDDCSGKAFVTGNFGSGTLTSDNVNNGYTQLVSPVMDLTTYVHPYINYARWFFDGGNKVPNDSMIISIGNGLTTVKLETIVADSLTMSKWINYATDLTGKIALTANMNLMVTIKDDAPAHILEGGFDHFQVSEGPLSVPSNATNDMSQNFGVYPNPSGENFTLFFASTENNTPQTIEIIDIYGRVLERIYTSKEISKISFGENLPRGIYFLTCVQKEIKMCEKLVKY